MEFDDLYKKYSPKVYRICYGFFHDQEQAKDVTQETFVTIFKNLPGFENRSSIGTWIYRIATNKCLREIHIDKKRNTIPISDQITERREEGQSDMEDNIRQLHRYIAELLEIDRIIISLYLEEVSQKEIAEIVGMSHNNIRVRIHRIKNLLMKKFESHENI